MAFSVKSKSNNEVLFNQAFSTNDFHVNGFTTDELNYTLPYGSVKGRQWVFDGIRMIYSETDLTDYADMEWNGDTEMVTMHFNLKGKLSMTDLETRQTFDLSSNQHNIFYGREAKGIMKVEELNTKVFLIQFSKDAFLKMSSNGNEVIKLFAEAVAKNKAVAFSNINLNIDFPLQQCINSILDCPYADSLKRMYLLSKSIEMLVLQAESFNKVHKNPYTTLKTDYDKDRIVFARDYLLRHMDSPPTLLELSKIIGLNEFKLKKGFKETFGVTAFQYLSNTRLEQAKTDLLEHKKSATEIAHELGYSSPQHFSNAFKKKFGLSPTSIVKT